MLGWYNNLWQFRMGITINGSKVGNETENEYGFPVMISLTGLSKIKTNGADIRFTSADGITELPREIESYSSGALIAWVKADLSYTKNTVIYMYYGNALAFEPAANSTYGSQRVWDVNFLSVHHAKEDTDVNWVDSTQNGRTGTPTSVTATSSGKIDGAGVFNGTTSKISTGTDYVGITALTTSAWIYLTGYGGAGIGRIIDNGGKFVFAATSSNWIRCSSNGGTIIDSAAVLSLSAWFHVVFTRDTSGNASIYVNGALSGDADRSSGAPAAGSNVCIGSRPSDDARVFDGTLDEVRISNLRRTLGWIKTEYNNQSSPSTFYTVSREVNRSNVIGWKGMTQNLKVYATICAALATNRKVYGNRTSKLYNSTFSKIYGG